MKETWQDDHCKQNSPLYPTWFRWKKWIVEEMVWNSQFLYIPHGSDESFITVFSFLWLGHLYIPHGSDESVNKPSGADYFIFFISHMVQMKDTSTPSYSNLFTHLYIPHGSDESRWTLDIKSRVSQLYIPHGSDERSPVSQVSQILKTLYPTWFRWKLISGISEYTTRCSFISHMVQMKVIINE